MTTLLSLDVFAADEFRGNVGKLPVCQLLNDKAKPGLFIKLKDAKLAGWLSTPKDGAEEYTHIYNDESSEQGYFLANPKMHILSASPRLVEVTKNGAEAIPSMGKQGSIIANYETEVGQTVHHNEATKGQTTLRTYYLIQLLNEKNEFIHKLPLVLSVKGAAAAEFGKAWEAFCKMAESAYTNVKSPSGSYMTLNKQARACLIFNPKFKWAMAGTGTVKSAICAVESFVEPSGKDEASLGKSFNMAKAELIWGTQKSFTSFADTVLKQLEEFHPVPDGVDLALPQGQMKSALPPADDMDF